MQHPSLRRASLSDADSVRDLTRAAYADWVPLIGREPRPMTRDYRRAVRDHIIDLYEEDGELIALIEVVRHPAYLLIENIAVRPDRHGAGIGGLLLLHAERLAHSLGLTELRLYTNAAFASNITLYARRGFQEFLREPLRDGGVVVHMRRRIATAADPPRSSPTRRRS